jgi:peptidoglycan/xylan/chitin deacetylase (PgdA/CDA1 family)
MTVAAAVALLQAPAMAATGPVTVSLTFNDGLASQYQFARPVLQSHNVNGTFYVASSWVATTDAKYMRSWQLDDLYRDGDEIGGMGKDHKDLTASYSSDPSADLAYKQDQVCGDRQKLSDLGYSPVSFSYPFSAQNASAQSIVSGCGFTSGRVVGGLSSTGPTYAEQVPPGNAFNVRTLGTPNGPITLAALQSAVNAANSRGGGWLPIAFNAVCSSADSGYSACMAGAKPIDAAVLSQFLDWMASGAPAGSSVRTVRSVMGSGSQPPLPPRPTAVSLTFDDGDASQYGVRAMLNAHGQKASFYLNSGAIDDHEQGAMTWDQVAGLAADGNDIGGHTRTHVNLITTDTSYDSKWHEVCDDRARLVQQHLNPVSFAYPEGAFNSAAEGIVKGCGYQSARTAGALSAAGPRYGELLNPVDPYAFQALGTTYNGPITLQSLQDAVNAVVAHGGGWLPTVFHQVCYPGTPSYSACMAGYRPVDSTVLDGFMSWLADNAGRGISVRTQTDVVGGGAAVPQVAVSAPAGGSTVPSGQPTVSGSATGDGGVTVSVYAGRYSTVAPSQQLNASVAANGSWSVSVPTSLASGTYTVQATQARGGVVGRSVPVTFNVASP